MTINPSDGDIIDLLERIEAHLAILTEPVRTAARRRLGEEVLKTRARQDMFDLFDGRRSTAEIAAAVGTSAQAVRDLIRVLETQGLVSVQIEGNRQIATPKGGEIVARFGHRG